MGGFRLEATHLAYMWQMTSDQNISKGVKILPPNILFQKKSATYRQNHFRMQA